MPALNSQRYVLFLAVCLLVGCSKSAVSYKTVMDGGSAKGDKLWVTGFSSVMETSKPSVLFCQHSASNGPRQIGCFLIVREPPSPSGQFEHGWEGSIAMEGEKARVFGNLIAGSIKVPMEFRAELKEDLTAVSDEFRIGDVEYTLDKGRVFQIDLTAKPVAIVQHDIALHSVNAAETSDVEAFVRRTLNELKQDSPALAEFLKATK